MPIARLRIVLSILWLGFWLVTSLIFLLLPVLRRDEWITNSDALSAIIQISGLWTVPIGCFIAFWFPESGHSKRSERKVDAGAAWFALAFTLIAMILLSAILIITGLGDFAHVDELGNKRNGTLTERISEVIKYFQLISPLLLGVVGYVTRSSERAAEPAHEVTSAEDES